VQSHQEFATPSDMNAWKGVMPTVTVTTAILMFGSLSLQAEDEIKNGNFSSGLALWTYQAYGPSSNGGKKTLSKRQPCEVIEETPGNRAVQISLDPKEYTRLSQEFRIRKTQKKFTVSIRAKASSDFTSSRSLLTIYLRGLDSDSSNPGYSKECILKPGGEWETFTAELEPTTTATTIAVKVQLSYGTGTVLIDDIVVRDATQSATGEGGKLR
jgi:hypothetical protein